VVDFVGGPLKKVFCSEKIYFFHRKQELTKFWIQVLEFSGKIFLKKD
jgi:hypothetical protein